MMFEEARPQGLAFFVGARGRIRAVLLAYASINTGRPYYGRAGYGRQVGLRLDKHGAALTIRIDYDSV